MASNGITEQPISNEYDTQKQREAFESTKLGVKGLIDSGITHIPLIFHHPPETLFNHQDATNTHPHNHHDIPVIDMSTSTHSQLVDLIREAVTEFGFFQVVNHGVPVSLLSRLIEAVKAVHEVADEEKRGYFRRDIVNTGIGFGFYSNHDLFHAKAASWRYTVSVRLGPTLMMFRLFAGMNNGVGQGSEAAGKPTSWVVIGLGLHTDRLKGKSYLGRIAMVGHYYPYCPEPNKTIGISPLTDLGMLTILLQDQLSGLHVKLDNGWVNLKLVDGALVINIGDMFQILSNDKYKSGEHRVYANPWQQPRVSIGTFFGPGTDDETYGPLEELISPENPVLYKEMKYSELLTKFLIRESNSKSMANHFRL